MIAGAALALAFPKVGATWLAPFGAAALFWLWQSHASYRRAAALGFLAGFIFFAISFSWFGTTVGAYLGNFASVVIVVPAALEALAFVAAALLAIAAYRFAPPALAPVAAAAGFALAEWGRSVGVAPEYPPASKRWNCTVNSVLRPLLSGMNSSCCGV